MRTCCLLVCLVLGSCGAPSPADKSGGLQSSLDTTVVATQPAAPYRQNCCYQLSWTLLSQIGYYEVAAQFPEPSVYYPIFSDTLLWLDSSLVRLSGYVIPLEETGLDTSLFLSAFPYSQCFFCGNAGPESVVEVDLEHPLRHRLGLNDQHVVEGRLLLNDQDPEHMPYRIQAARVVTD